MEGRETAYRQVEGLRGCLAETGTRRGGDDVVVDVAVDVVVDVVVDDDGDGKVQ